MSRLIKSYRNVCPLDKILDGFPAKPSPTYVVFQKLPLGLHFLPLDSPGTDLNRSRAGPALCALPTVHRLLTARRACDRTSPQDGLDPPLSQVHSDARLPDRFGVQKKWTKMKRSAFLAIIVIGLGLAFYACMGITAVVNALSKLFASIG